MLIRAPRRVKSAAWSRVLDEFLPIIGYIQVPKPRSSCWTCIRVSESPALHVNQYGILKENSDLT
jgi:hypothetical protein